MALSRYDPFMDTALTPADLGGFGAWDPSLNRMQNMMNRMLQDTMSMTPSTLGAGGLGLGGGAGSALTSWRPLTDVYDDGKQLRIHAELPGIPKENVKADIRNGNLVIEGESRSADEKDVGNAMVRERRFGRYRRVIALPPDVDTDNVSASFNNGVLEMSIPKKQEAEQGRRIQIQ